VIKKNEIKKIDNDYFESVIVFNLLTNNVYLNSVIDIINPEYFTNVDIKSIISIITDFYSARGAAPNNTEIKVKLISKELKESFTRVVLSFKHLDSYFNLDELVENTTIFLKEKAVYCAVSKTIADYADGNVDTSKTLKLFEQACNISIIDELGHDYFSEVDKHIADLQETYTYIPSGFSWLDKKLGGGFLSSGRAIYCFSGIANVGKSIFLGNIATNIIAQGRNVVLISLEMSESVYARRISSQLSDIPMNELSTHVNELKSFLIKYSKNNPEAKLFLKEFPPKMVTYNHIVSYIKMLELKRGFKPDAIIIDYINLINSLLPTGSSYSDIKSVTENLRALSYVFRCPVISATQLTRGAYGLAEPGMEMTGESIGLSQTVDAQMSIWSEEGDEELGVIRLGIMKNRQGPNYGNIILKINYDTLKVYQDKEGDDIFASETEANVLGSTLGKLSGNLKILE